MADTLWKIVSPTRMNRRTGWASLIGFSVMVLSGYLIQVASGPALITPLIWTHVATGILFA